MTVNHPRAASMLGVAALIAVGALSGCSSTPEATASEKDRPTTLTFTLAEADSEFEQIDVGDKGESVGDRHISAVTLQDDGQDAGRMQIDCLVVDNAYEGQMCTMVAMLPGGTIAFQNAGLHKPLGDADTNGDGFAVTGGTGDYAGAAGEMTIGEEENSPVTITLLP